MSLDELFLRGALALALGLIIGFQRERKQSGLAGIRTFPLFSLSGFFSSLLGVTTAGVIGLSLLLVVGMYRNTEERAQGLTTEIAAVLVFLLGAGLAVFEHISLVAVAGGVCALLLHLKERMHGLTRALDQKEVQAIMQFVLIAFIILPILPDKTYDNYEVLNPQRIWLMVVLITGISLVSFAVQKVRGNKAGALWSGILGGLISSTAATVSLSRVSSRDSERRSFIPAILIASTIALVRVMFEILVVAPQLFIKIIPPLGILLVFMVGMSVFSLYRSRKVESTPEVAHEGSPSELKAAMVFGFLFAVILYLSAWTREEFGDQGLYAVSIISGLIDVDAITLSTTELIEKGAVSAELGGELIMVAFLSNLVFKSLMVLALSRGTVRKHVTFYLLLSTVLGAGIVLLA